MKKFFLTAFASLSLFALASPASAQSFPRYAAPAMAAPAMAAPAMAAPARPGLAYATPVGPMNQGNDLAEVHDDVRDLRQLQSLAMRYERALRSGNGFAARNTLNAFVRAGRAEVAELQVEAQRAQRETMRSRFGHRRDARRDATGEFARLQQATQILAQLEGIAGNLQTGRPLGGFEFQQVQQSMRGFIDLARAELRASRMETLELRTAGY